MSHTTVIVAASGACVLTFCEVTRDAYASPAKRTVLLLHTEVISSAYLSSFVWILIACIRVRITDLF